MNIDDADVWSLKGLSAINVVLGKNGCGKSSLLRAIERHRQVIPTVGHVAYMTPERSGVLVYEAHVEQQLIGSQTYLNDNRRNNQFTSFKQQSVAQYRKLQNLVMSEVEDHIKTDKPGKPVLFDSYLTKLNSLLDEVAVVRKDTAFAIVKKGTNTEIPASVISSGEAELISLGIETLVFDKEVQRGKTNVLLFDEPDVHLHPDLQVRLMDFLADRVRFNPFTVIIATHSTPVLAALSDHEGVSLAFMRAGQRVLNFAPLNEVQRRILPMFGAHPLSNVFNRSPILLVEGEDDERIWQQVVRSSQGRIRLYPCNCDAVNQMAGYEAETKRIIESVYDNARAYSVRDGDGKHEAINDDPPLARFRLQCYSAENLLLSDEVLTSLGTNWSSVRAAIDTWLATQGQHKNHARMGEFKASGFDRRDFNLKEIRNDLMSLTGSAKPWEVAVGQVIAGLTPTLQSDFAADGSIFTFLGEKLVKALLPNPVAAAVWREL